MGCGVRISDSCGKIRLVALLQSVQKTVQGSLSPKSVKEVLIFQGPLIKSISFNLECRNLIRRNKLGSSQLKSQRLEILKCTCSSDTTIRAHLSGFSLKLFSVKSWMKSSLGSLLSPMMSTVLYINMQSIYFSLVDWIKRSTITQSWNKLVN